MKKSLLIILILLLAALALFACSEEEVKIFDTNAASFRAKTGELGDFSAKAPTMGLSTLDVPSFSWTASENAETYELEITTNTFSYADDSYFKITGITSTDYTIGAALKNKNTTYYWRVTAVNSEHRKVFANEKMEFYYRANVREQIEMDVIHVDDWERHKEGSVATLSLDRNDFFGTGNDSLVIKFLEEDTNQGAGYEKSDGWVLFGHDEEIELYGVDGFYFNFYYAGDDADIKFRVVDDDNEYWYAPIKLANNAKQTIIIHRDEFILRDTKDTPAMNHEFDFENLKRFEIVFEHSFGDGIAYFSDLRIITYDLYEPLFVEELNFNDYNKDLKYENYTFTTEVSEDGKALTYSFDKDIQGYGFVKVPLTTPQDVQEALDVKMNGAILARGDALRMKVKLNDTNLSADKQITIRLVEEDGDRWVYQQPVGTIPAGGVLIIPYAAFTMSEFGGDGFRQFYGVKELQFGVDNSVYTKSSVTISDVAVVTLADELKEAGIEPFKTKVGTDGMIEDFDGEEYTNALAMYYKWQMSTANKDEAMKIDDTVGLGVDNSVGRFYYKTNMDEALYTINFDPVENNPYNGIELDVKALSVTEVEMDDKSKREVTIYPWMIVYLVTDNGNVYSYPQVNYLNEDPDDEASEDEDPDDETIDLFQKIYFHPEDDWYSLKIPFTAFGLYPGYTGDATPDADSIVQISIGIHATVTQFGNDKDYVTGSSVAIDNIRFANVTELSWDALETKIAPTAGNADLTVIDDFDTTDNVWAANPAKIYTTLTSSEVTASDEGKSLAFGYQTRSDATYYRTLSMASSVKAQGIRFLMKAEQKDHYIPSASIVLYVRKGGTDYKYQYDLADIAESWTDYTIGFDCFTKDNAGIEKLSKDDARYISQITIVFKDYKNAPQDTYAGGKIYIDEIVLDNTIALTANARTEYTK